MKEYTKTKGILHDYRHGKKDGFCIIVPKYYKCEAKPSNCIVFVGSLEECKKEISNLPDYFIANMEEETEMRKINRTAYEFYLSIGKKKYAEKNKLAHSF